MTSINTNIAATTALRTLQSTNMQLDATQSRISTGLKIGEAKDNAAYWSISTTLKSDNKALGTVKDALGLGAATVDTAYQGMNATLDVLNEIKSKIMAGSQDNVDKVATQAEIAALQEQLSSIANISDFSGENWLSGNSSVNSNFEKSVVSSFSRDAGGNVTLGTITIDTKGLMLIDNSNGGEGILNAGKSGNATLTGGMTSALTGAQAVTGGTPSTQATTLSGTATAAGTITFDVVLNGATTTLTVGVADTDTAAVVGAEIANQLGLSGLSGVAYNVGTGQFSTTANNGATLAVSNIAGVPTGLTLTAGAAATGTAGAASGSYLATSATAFAAVTLDANDSISFNVSVNGRDSVAVRVDQETVNAALEVENGAITTATQYATVLNRALKDAGVSGLTASNSTTLPGQILFTGTSDTTAFTVSTGVANNGESILDLNIVGADAAKLATYLTEINAAIDKTTAGAAQLGAMAARIELQNTFVTNLMDTIDQGISGLVDADMNEESTRLQALQVKQQLGVQALSIANQSAQNVLSLFR